MALKILRTLSCALLLIFSSLVAHAEMYIVSKSDLTGLTERITERIYTGKQIELNGRTLVPINYVSEYPARQKFLSSITGKTDTEYVAYWATRRYVGLGVPPEEVRDRAKMLSLLGTRENAIGYVEASPEEAIELRRRFTVLLVRSDANRAQ